MVATSRIVKCTTLRQACLTVNEPQPSCSGTCRKRPFRLDVYGDSAAADVAAVMRERQLKDPLTSFRTRSLRRDVIAHNGSKPPTELGPPLSMFWPTFEVSHGDFVRDTLVPLANLLGAGALPPRLGLAYQVVAAALHLKPIAFVGLLSPCGQASQLP